MLATLKQERFVNEYLLDLNGQQAAIRSGYSPASAKVQASRLLTNDNIRLLIQRKQRETEQRLKIQRDDIIRGFLAAAMEAKQQEDPVSMIAAYREIGRMLGYYGRPPVEFNVDELSMARIQEMTDKELLKLSEKGPCLNLNNVDDDWVIK